MKLIKQNVELLNQYEGLKGIFKQIELAGRVCYNSENKITEDSAEDFVNQLIASNHLSVLEHGTVYLTIPISEWNSEEDVNQCIYAVNPYSKINDYDVDYLNRTGNVYITTNYRVIVENNLYNDLQFLTEPRIAHHKRYTIRCTTDIGVSREFNRHRKLSISERSTRYCNFSKDKFNNEITFILPHWVDDHYLTEYNNLNVGELNPGMLNDLVLSTDDNVQIWIESLVEVEKYYLSLINGGWIAQKARQVLPLNTATIVVYTGYEEDWKHFFDLRLKGTSGAPHPNMKELAALILDEFNKNNINFYKR